METVKHRLNAGRLIVGAVTRRLKQMAFDHDVTVSIDKSGGLLDVDLFIKTTGERSKLDAFWREVWALVARLQRD